jgi:hypothetical protein
MKTGWPDLTCVWNHGIAFIEVKRPKFTPSCVSKDQRAIHVTLAEMGFPVAIATCEEEAFQHLRDRGAPWNGIPVR